MATLLERVAALVRANVNWMVDKAMQANSPAMLDDYLRKLEEHLTALEESCATVGGNAKTFGRLALEHAAKADTFNERVDDLLRAGHDNVATDALRQAKVEKRQADLYRGQAAAMEAQYSQLLDARTKLQGKIALVKQERDELVALLDLAKAKEVNLKAFKSVASLVDLEDPDISRVAEGIRARLDRADVALQIQAGDLDSQMTDILGQDRDRAEIEQRKRQLGLIKD